MTRLTAVLLTLALLGPLAGGASAQATCGSMAECSAPEPYDVGFRQHLATAGLNALLGGVTAAAQRALRGEPVWDALWKGAVGGGVVYAGKRVAVEGFDGAGLVGRELASVGGSMVRNAAAGRGALDELALPLGPVRLYVSRTHGVVPRLDLATVVSSVAFVAAYDARLDLGASLSSGAMVFRGRGGMPGLSGGGAMLLWSEDEIPVGERSRLQAHERVHILQYDQTFLSWGEGLERWVVDRTATRGWLADHVDIGAFALGIQGGLGMTLEYGNRPWEKEAYFLAQTAHPLGTTLDRSH